MANNVIEATEATFITDVLEQSQRQPVIVDFWAPWCGPCRVLSPVLERVTNDSHGAFTLVKINVDDNPNVAAQYGVQGIPAVKIFRNGSVAGEFVGAIPESSVREIIKRYTPSPMDARLAAAEALVHDKLYAEAEVVYREIIAAQPDQAEARLQLGKLQLISGQGAAAEATLRSVPGHTLESVKAEALLPVARLLSFTPDGSTKPIDELYQSAASLIGEGKYAEGLNALLDVLRKNRNYREGEAKQAVLAMFEFLGDDPLVAEYRRKLANVLF